MNVVRLCAVLALFAALSLVPSVAFSQAGAASDFLKEIVLDHNAPPGAPDVPLTPPAVSVTFVEGNEPIDALIPIPGREIDFLEGAAPTPTHISDRLSISPYQVRVISDDSLTLPRRTNAMLIPASALETFLPFSIIASSDGEQSGLTQESDHLTITLGYYGPGTGKPEFDGTITEPLPEDVTEPVLFHVIPPMQWDIEEPLAETGGIPGIISDYVDVSEIQVRFISSDDPLVYANLPPANGFVFENIETGGGVSYALGFSSDAVPEPTSLMLIGLGALALAAAHRRRAD